MIEVKITYIYKGKFCVETDGFMTPCVPRVGDTFSIQYWDCPITSVNWAKWTKSVEDPENNTRKEVQVLHATIYVDVSKTDLKWTQIQ